MKKTELKKVLKPLIKECIKEMLLEEGLLGNVIQEVVSNMPSQPLIAESRYSTQERRDVQPPPLRQAPVEQPTLDNMPDDIKAELEESRTKLEQQLASQLGVNVLEGLKPIDAGGTVTEGVDMSAMSPLGDPNDPGVNISGILKLAGKKWGKFK